MKKTKTSAGTKKMASGSPRAQKLARDLSVAFDTTGWIDSAQKAHDSYLDLVEAGKWPAEPAVPLPRPFRNDAGSIQNLCLRPVTSVACIESRTGSMRANHYHKTDWHYTYVASGQVIYFERPVKSKARTVSDGLRVRIFRAGEMFFTPPMVEHCMLFAADSTIITLAKNVRSHESHESDVVRVKFVTRAMADKFLHDWWTCGQIR